MKYRADSTSPVIYLLWSYLPSPFLHQLGLYYYPNRWWSLAIPASLVMTLLYIYVALAAYNTEYLTLPLSSIENMVDEAANIAVLDSSGRIKRYARQERTRAPTSSVESRLPETLDWKAAWSEGTHAVMDVPISGVCEILYGQ